ncbi:glutathione peroxidase [Zoogloea sp. LCSB751]|uniref:glutathione peroxidase n=1 Tax=Zoogloea sp. LCSB751 TaxID=1965277 RepID=UPI0009A50E4B|nr:glutathione peroxidase [Zoogloea sp. LCSB751]
MSIYDIPVQRIDGTPATLGDYRGRVLLIVNVASACGLTPQYAGLEALQQKYRSQGLVVLGFPCNDFGAQEPGSEAEIQSFCEGRFQVSFPLFAKLGINSERHPLYDALIAAMPVATSSVDGRLRDVLVEHGLLPARESDVMWNFEKFLVNQDGSVVGRFAPDIAPDHPALVAAIESLLG